MKNLLIFIFFLFFSVSNIIFSQNTKGTDVTTFDKSLVEKTIKSLIDTFGTSEKFRIEKGVYRVASFWTKEDGNPKEFMNFCKSNFIANSNDLEKAFNKLSYYFETLSGNINEMAIGLQQYLQLDLGEIHPVDLMFGSYDPSANLNEDFFKTKIAFYSVLNFPFYSLQEKEEHSSSWNRLEWAYARMGDKFTSRIPSAYLQKIAEVQTKADSYISEYNIMAGFLVDNKGTTHFPKDKKLISHWNLRDELKSNYNDKDDGLDKQRLIYEVMKRIISQEIPENVINSDKYQWNPFQNKAFSGGKEISFKSEPNTRYQHLLNNFNANKDLDKFCPEFPTYIQRKFEQEMEMPQNEVESLFSVFVSSPIIRQTGDLIKRRLGRNLEPFDIWYDGFKERANYNETELDSLCQKKYPTTGSFAHDMPLILTKLGFSEEDIKKIPALVSVDPARGAGHALGALMKSEKSHLRTRIAKNGMNYKGYNIACHEFGHNVEQTIDLQDVDYYMLAGVPNTAFTEAWAFVFQGRDLQLLGFKDDNPHTKYLKTLDILWSAYEIMGVSLVDMNVWKWLYANPQANVADLKNAVLKISKDIWNRYYADIFGIQDQTILAIYSHMIDYPLYLSAYPIGNLIQFEYEKAIEGKQVGTEMKRMLVQGRLTPQAWMKGAVGHELSPNALLQAADEALKLITN
jgi:hypothetical protein